jgi:hypothetical protein
LFTTEKSGTSQPKAEQCEQEEKSTSLGMIGGGSAATRWVGAVATKLLSSLVNIIFGVLITPNETQDQRPCELEMMFACSQI